MTAHDSFKKIKQLTGISQASVGIICGSGLGDLELMLSDPHPVDYKDLPGFPQISVEGHSGKLILGTIGKTSVCLLKGRKHFYEGIDPIPIQTYIRTLKLLGCHTLLITNASGSLRPDFKPGHIMLIRDHINLQGVNPLVGLNDEDFGPRFPNMANAYDADLRDLFINQARSLSIPFYQGTYVGVLGPSYETAAEIRAFQVLGGDAVGMSTISEAILARHCGMRVAGLATLTNWGTGLSTEEHDHQQVLSIAQNMGKALSELIKEVVSLCFG